ncbi:MAG: hypothetical protein Q7U02_02530, partial [Desulfosalsimonadaceae bacterium]|nr:hypothetical protein [Desulfosalsimonadaceae bacterium]
RCEYRNNMTDAMEYLKNHKVKVLISDIMMPGGQAFSDIDSSETGFHFVDMVRREYPDVSVICLSVIGDQSKIQVLKRKGVLYLRKGETPLDNAARLIESKATGVYRYGS